MDNIARHYRFPLPLSVTALLCKQALYFIRYVKLNLGKSYENYIIIPFVSFVSQVIDSSDILVQVLDSRDPMGTRSTFVETYLKKEKPHKHLVFVMNKVDLVPTWVTVIFAYLFISFCCISCFNGNPKTGARAGMEYHSYKGKARFPE